VTTKRRHSNTPKAESDVELHDAEQKQSADVALTKEERVDRAASTSSGFNKVDKTKA
jgi:hypothetical protein